MPFILPKPFRRGSRPVEPSSLPVYVDAELDRVATAIAEVRKALEVLDQRLTALEP